jgi:hypothetical protein
MARAVIPVNTDITGEFHEEGALDKGAHERVIYPLRAHIRKRAGVVLCNVYRFEIEVIYRDEIVSREGIIQYVREAIVEFRDEPGFFPQRGSKVPDVVVPELPSPTHAWVTIHFTTDLTVYHPDHGRGGHDMAAFRAATNGLVNALVATDGVANWSCTLTSVGLCFRLDRNDRERVEEHMRQVLDEQTRRRPDYFPYAAVSENSSEAGGSWTVPVDEVVYMESVL